MATTFNGTKLAGPALAMAGVGDGQGMKAMSFSYTWAAAFVINDLIQSPPIQKGATVLDVMICTDSMGSGAVTLDVGYGGNPDQFIAASTIGVAGGVARASSVEAKPLVLTTNDTIDILIKAAPTGATTSGTISAVIFYQPANT